MEDRKLLSSAGSDYLNDTHDWAEIDRQIHLLAKAGFTHTQWMADWEGEYLYSPSEMMQARDMLKHYGIYSHTIHATEGGKRSILIGGKRMFRNRYRFTEIRKDYTSKDECMRLAGVELLKNRIDLCSYFGAHVMVLHMQLPYMLFESEPTEKTCYYRQVMKSFDEVRPYAQVAGVRIALENMICTPQKYQDEQFELMFDRYDSDFMGYCYDSGHASLMCREDYYHFPKTFNDRMIATHLQDNSSISDELLHQPDGDMADHEVLMHDAHWIPNVDGSLTRGILDWELIARYVASAPVELPADFEVNIIPADGPIENQVKVCHREAEAFYQKVVDIRAESR